MIRFLCLATTLCLSCISGLQASMAQQKSDADIIKELSQYQSPKIVDGVLYINGRIDSHIYDFLSFEHVAVQKVVQVSLNSLGGSTHWALEIARTLRKLAKPTSVSYGQYCLSACVFLFAAGTKRFLSERSELGLHGSRFGASAVANYKKLCLFDLMDPEAPAGAQARCDSFLEEKTRSALEKTHLSFDSMELSGVSTELRDFYLRLPDGELVDRGQLNVLRKPDLFLNATLALQFQLATDIVPVNF